MSADIRLWPPLSMPMSMPNEGVVDNCSVDEEYELKSEHHYPSAEQRRHCQGQRLVDRLEDGVKTEDSGTSQGNPDEDGWGCASLVSDPEQPQEIAPAGSSFSAHDPRESAFY